MQLAVVPNDRTIIIGWNSVKKAFGGRWYWFIVCWFRNFTQQRWGVLTNPGLSNFEISDGERSICIRKDAFKLVFPLE